MTEAERIGFTTLPHYHIAAARRESRLPGWLPKPHGITLPKAQLEAPSTDDFQRPEKQ